MKVMDEFDDELTKRLKQFSAEPRESLWDSISERIETEDRDVRLQKKMRFGWIFIFSSILIGGFFYFVTLDSERNTSIVRTGNETELTTNNPGNVASKRAEVLPELRLQKKQDVQKIEGQYPKKYNRGFEYNTSINFEIEELSTTGERENNTLDNLTTHVEIAPANRSSLTNEVSSDSPKNLVTLKTKEINKIEQQPDDINLEKKRNRPNIYFTIMPTLGYQRIEPNSQDNLIIESIDRVATFSPDRLGVRAELGAEHPITSRINVFGGFVYFQRHQTIGYTERQASETEISNGPDGDVIVETKYTYLQKSFDYDVRNLGLQIGANYQLSKKKFLHTVGTGIEFHVALNKVQHSQLTTEFTNNPSLYIFYNLYYRLQYPATTKLRAVMQPTLNYSFYINQNANAPFYVKPYGLGLNIGFTYNF
jgi:hypothetical protein